jgi:hypothetical protein
VSLNGQSEYRLHQLELTCVPPYSHSQMEPNRIDLKKQIRDRERNRRLEEEVVRTLSSVVFPRKLNL